MPPPPHNGAPGFYIDKFTVQPQLHYSRHQFISVTDVFSSSIVHHCSSHNQSYHNLKFNSVLTCSLVVLQPRARMDVLEEEASHGHVPRLPRLLQCLHPESEPECGHCGHERSLQPHTTKRHRR